MKSVENGLAKRVFVTGAAGFTGQYMVARLAEDGYEIHALAKEPVTDAHPHVAAWYIAGLEDGAALRAVFEQVQPDFVIHLAAIAFVGHDNPDQFYQINLLGTRNLLQAMVDAQVKPSAVLIASSANIYGNQYEGRLSETTLPNPGNDYAVSKLSMEYMCRLYRNQLPIIITRPFNYTGVGQSPSFLIPKIVDHVRRRAATVELGNIEVERDFSDVRSVVDAYARLIAEPEAVGGTFNICSGETISLQDIVTMACALAGHSMAVRVNPAFVRANEVRSLSGDKRQLEQAIGPLNMPKFEETLRWMLDA